MAATLSSNYGIYGPTYELCIGLPLKEGSEEYLNSEKYQIQNWDLDQSHSLFDLIRKINTLRKNNTCLQYNHHLFSHHTENDCILAFSKRTDGKSNVILVIANLDPFQTQSSFVYLNMEELGLNWHDHFEVYDLITEKSYLWQGSKNYVELNPQVLPVHVFQIRK